MYLITLSNKLLVSLIVLILIAVALTSPKVNAREITPADGSYSYGSTSEYSASTTISSSPSSSESDDLAPTGQDRNIPVIVGGMVVLLGILILVLSQRKLRKK